MRRGIGEHFVVGGSAPPTHPFVADSSLPPSGRGILRRYNKKTTAKIAIATILPESLHVPPDCQLTPKHMEQVDNSRLSAGNLE